MRVRLELPVVTDEKEHQHWMAFRTVEMADVHWPITVELMIGPRLVLGDLSELRWNDALQCLTLLLPVLDLDIAALRASPSDDELAWNVLHDAGSGWTTRLS